MKKYLWLLINILISPIAYAAAPGFYMGVAFGPSTNTASDLQIQVSGSPTTTNGQPRSNQFGSRVFVGYDLNQYAGVELGGNYFSEIHYKTSQPTCAAVTGSQVKDVDLTGKGKLPIRFFEVYGKAGVAMTFLHKSGDLFPVSSGPCSGGSSTIQYRPTFGVGGSYDISQNWVADISWTRLMVGQQINNVNFYALGISYHFVDKYCGQFLC